MKTPNEDSDRANPTVFARRIVESDSNREQAAPHKRSSQLPTKIPQDGKLVIQNIENTKESQIAEPEEKHIDRLEEIERRELAPPTNPELNNQKNQVIIINVRSKSGEPCINTHMIHEQTVKECSDRKCSQSQLLQTQNLKESAQHGLLVEVNLFMHAFLMGFIPSIVCFAIFAVSWGLDDNFEAIMVYYLCSSSLLSIVTYLSVFSFVFLMFGKDKSKHLLVRVTLPSVITHVVVYNSSMLFNVPFLSFVYYFVFMAHFGVLFYCVRTRSQIDIRNPETKFEIMASDGTPLAVVKGFTACCIVYYISVYHLVPFIIESKIALRLLGRLVFLPFLFNLADSYQTSLIIFKSIDCMRHRMIVGNFSNIIYQTSVRLLIANAPNPTETAIMSLSSAIFEIVCQISYIPRIIYAKRSWRSIKEFFVIGIIKNVRVENLANVVPPAEPSSSNRWQSMHIRSDDGNCSQAACSTGKKGPHSRRKSFLHMLNDEEKMLHHIIKYRMIRSRFVAICELQLIVFVPFTMFLYHPVRDYIAFQTFPTLQEAILSSLIQLPFEILTQLTTITLDQYLYGIQEPTIKMWKKALQPAAITQNMVFSLAAFYLAVNPFWLSPSDWP